MIKYFFNFFFVLFLILPSCRNENKITIEETDNQNLISTGLDSSNLTQINNILDLENVIELKGSDTNPISNTYFIKRVLNVKDRIYILDERFSAILMYDINGNFIGNVGNKGIKKGEFVLIEDVYYDEFNDILLALCNTPNKLIKFSLDGKFLSETYLKFYASDLIVENKNSIYFYVNQNNSPLAQQFNVLRTDSNFNVLDRAFKIPPQNDKAISSTGGLIKGDKNIYFSLPYERNIYEINSNGIKLKYKVDFGKEGNIDDVDFKLSNYYIKKSYPSKKSFFVSDLVGINYLKGGKKVLDIFKDENRIFSSISGNPIDNLFNEGAFYTGNKIFMIFTPKFKIESLIKYKEEINNFFPLLTENFKGRNNSNIASPYLLVFNLRK